MKPTTLSSRLLRPFSFLVRFGSSLVTLRKPRGGLCAVRCAACIKAWDTHSMYQGNFDKRVQRYLEAKLGFSIQSIPSKGISVRESSARTEEPKNHLLMYSAA
jgi:hypothetical protein